MNLGTATIHNAGSSAIRVSSDIGTEVTIAPGASADVRVAYRRDHIELTIQDVPAERSADAS